ELTGTVKNQFGSSLGGIRVFLDLDGNGEYEATNPTTTTDADGHYSFNNLTHGKSYSVIVSPSDPSFTAPAAQTIKFTDGVQSPANFTVTETPSIQGTAFRDLNFNGSRDPGEPGLGGLTVYLDVTGAGHFVEGDPVTITGPDGTYGFFNLDLSHYTVA